MIIITKPKQSKGRLEYTVQWPEGVLLFDQAGFMPTADEGGEAIGWGGEAWAAGDLPDWAGGRAPPKLVPRGLVGTLTSRPVQNPADSGIWWLRLDFGAEHGGEGWVCERRWDVTQQGWLAWLVLVWTGPAAMAARKYRWAGSKHRTSAAAPSPAV